MQMPYSAGYFQGGLQPQPFMTGPMHPRSVSPMPVMGMGNAGGLSGMGAMGSVGMGGAPGNLMNRMSTMGPGGGVPAAMNSAVGG